MILNDVKMIIKPSKYAQNKSKILLLFPLIILFFIVLVPQTYAEINSSSCGIADFCINNTTGFDAGVLTNTTTITDRFNISNNTLELDFPYAEKDANLITYWRMEGNSTDITDNHNGTDSGSIVYSTSNGKFGQGADMTGTAGNTNILIGSHADLKPASGFTVSQWVRTTDFNDALNGGIAQGFIFGGPGAFSWLFELNGGNTVIIIRNTGATTGIASVPIVDNNWHLWTMTYAGDGNISLYKDGSLANNSSVAPPVDYTVTDLNFRIGARSNGLHGLEGDTDEIKYYDRALSRAQISTLYNNGDQYVSTGNWTSATQTITLGNQLKNTTIVHSDLTINNTIDRIEWLNASNGVVLATYETNITTGLNTTINESNLTSGTFDDVINNFKIRVFMVGNNTTTPIISEIFGNSELIPVIPNSILSKGFTTNTTNITIDGFVGITEHEFNTTSANTEIIVFLSLNIEKLNAGAPNIIGMRLLNNGTEIFNQSLGTLDATNEIRVAPISPFIFNEVETGPHTLTLEMNRTGLSGIRIKNIDFILTQFITNDLDLIDVEVVERDFGTPTTIFSPRQNHTFISTVIGESLTFFFFNLNTSSPTGADISLYQENNDTGTRSIGIIRNVDGIGEIGTVGFVHIDTTLTKQFNHTFFMKTTSGTSFLQDAQLHMSLRDNSSHRINFFNVTNSSTNLTNTISLGVGTHLLRTGNLTILNGDSVVVFAGMSLGTSSGAQTPTLFLNSSNLTQGECFTQKEITLDGNSDIGNILMFTQCINVSVGENIMFDLFLTVPTGETVVVHDEFMLGFDTTTFETFEQAIVIIVDTSIGILIKIWLLMAILGTCLLIMGILNLKVLNGHLMLMLLSNPILLLTSIYSFRIIKSGTLIIDTDTLEAIVVTQTFSFPWLGMLFFGLWCINLLIIIGAVFVPEEFNNDRDDNQQ